MSTFPGGCHCGDVRFEVDFDFDAVAVVDCNCSICTKKGILHAIVPPAQFRLLTPREKLATYTFNTGVAQHTFCARCGMHPFYTPRSHPDHVDVNVRCLDGVDVGARTVGGARFRVDAFDGRHWEDNVATLRGMTQESSTW